VCDCLVHSHYDGAEARQEIVKDFRVECSVLSRFLHACQRCVEIEATYFSQQSLRLSEFWEKVPFCEEDCWQLSDHQVAYAKDYALLSEKVVVSAEDCCQERRMAVSAEGYETSAVFVEVSETSWLKVAVYAVEIETYQRRQVYCHYYVPPTVVSLFSLRHLKSAPSA